MKKIIIVCILAFYSCSPLKSSPKEEKHKMELTLHEIQTNLDDLRHDLNCFRTEFQIVDAKIKNQEKETHSIKKNFLEEAQNQLKSCISQLSEFKKQVLAFDKKVLKNNQDINALSNYANETTSALSQHKNRMEEIENLLLKQNKRLDEVANLKSTLETIASSIKDDTFKTYKVKQADTLQKIASMHDVTVKEIKELNKLKDNIIIAGQNLKIPQKQNKK